jgi:hypothetical protein
MSHELIRLLSATSVLTTPLITAVIIYIAFVATEWMISPLLDILSMRLASSRPTSQNTLFELQFPDQAGSTLFRINKLYDLIYSHAHEASPISLQLKRKKTYSLEFVATQGGRIRYLIGIPQNDIELITESLKRNVPGLTLKKTSSNFPRNNPDDHVSVAELTLKSDFALPVRDSESLKDHDPLLYLTGQMAKLRPGEYAAFQMILSPIRATTHLRVTHRIQRLKKRIADGRTMSSVTHGLSDVPLLLVRIFQLICLTIIKKAFLLLLLVPKFLLRNRLRSRHRQHYNPKPLLSEYEQELTRTMSGKLSQSLFEVSLRIVSGDQAGPEESTSRLTYLTYPFNSYTNSHQRLKARINLPGSNNRRLRRFTEHMHSHQLLRLNPVLSTSELAGLYHFPALKEAIKAAPMPKARQIIRPQAQPRASFDTYFGDKIYDDRFDPIGLNTNWLASGPNTEDIRDNEAIESLDSPLDYSVPNRTPTPKQQLALSFGETLPDSHEI